MGQVYRAKDSTLKREVALKVLPADVAKDRERLARFQREAEVLASLNHPHIAHENTNDFDHMSVPRHLVSARDSLSGNCLRAERHSRPSHERESYGPLDDARRRQRTERNR